MRKLENEKLISYFNKFIQHILSILSENLLCPVAERRKTVT